MMRCKYLSLLGFILAIACQSNSRTPPTSLEEKTRRIHQFLDQWHRDAALADREYFRKIAADGIYIGTDKGEYWTRAEFEIWAQKYFDEGTTWKFTANERHVYFDESGEVAWFDELLDTWMGVCRSSGVLTKTQGGWEIKHYHLSLAVPNESIEDIIELINSPNHAGASP